MIPRFSVQKLNEAYERMLKSDVKYRFSSDMASLKGETATQARTSTPEPKVIPALRGHLAYLEACVAFHLDRPEGDDETGALNVNGYLQTLVLLLPFAVSQHPGQA